MNEIWFIINNLNIIAIIFITICILFYNISIIIIIINMDKDEINLITVKKIKRNKNQEISLFCLLISSFMVMQFLLIIYLLISHKHLKKQINKLTENNDYLNKQVYILFNEINVTKLHCFYEIRTRYLQENNLTYTDNNITTFTDYLNWLIIHDTNYLKSLATF